MTVEIVLAVIGIATGLVTLTTFVATAVWAVAQVKEATSTLRVEINHLAKGVDRLNSSLEDHELRLRTLESSRHTQT